METFKSFKQKHPLLMIGLILFGIGFLIGVGIWIKNVF
jgi:hypothetical protein